MTSLELNCHWLDRFEDSDPCQAETVAELSIRIGTRYATALEDVESGETRRTVRASAYPLALFLASNWWRLRWEPETDAGNSWLMAHSLAAAGDGYAWPSVTFASDGERIRAEVRDPAADPVMPVRYLARFGEWVTATDFEHGIDAFVATVLERLKDRQLGASALQQLWTQLCAERADDGWARWRKLEALAGFDPDEAPEIFIQRLLDESETTGWAAMDELAAASRQQALADLQCIREAAVSYGVTATLDTAPAVGEGTPPAESPMAPPWLRGVRAAEALRSRLSLGLEPLTNQRLADLAATNHRLLNPTSPEIKSPYSALVRAEGGSRLVLEPKAPTSRRFHLARLLGDHALFPGGEGMRVATGVKTARQQFQRAFAQELLAPVEGLRAYFGGGPIDDDRIDAAAAHFDVSPLVVQHALDNNELRALV